MKADGSWTLSPAFDINPMPLKRPDSPYESKLYLTPEIGSECGAGDGIGR